jgi:hypothetical protein
MKYRNICIFLLFTSILLVSFLSFVIMIFEWDSNMSRWMHESIPFQSYSLLALVTFLLCMTTTYLYMSSCCRSTQNFAEYISPKSFIYQNWLALLFARSCHVWVFTVSNQRIISACNKILTIGAPYAINISCVNSCHNLENSTQHRLPFLTNDLYNTSDSCSPWFLDKHDDIVWSLVWETILFSCLTAHIASTFVTSITDKIQLTHLLAIDIVSCLSTASLVLKTDTYYSFYNIGGVFRFLGLLHFLAPWSYYRMRKKLMGVIIVMKLLFIALMGTALMFVAEKPCSALRDECDDGFENFGDTFYFIFVTLSTVGYGDMSPKTTMGKISIVVISLASISYLPSIIAEVLEMCHTNPIHGRLDEMHEDIRQVGHFMHGGTLKRNSDDNSTGYDVDDVDENSIELEQFI